MSEVKENERPTQYIYLGNLSPELQVKFLGFYKDAENHGVTSVEFVTAWNSYATSIEEHVFITDTPGTAQVPQQAES